jgi:UDP-N-acetylmuramoyl-tripeptide--D-alanyl-D-alanine ligase
MKELIILSQLLVFLAKTVHFTYLFQIKEYRFDRVYSYLREQGILRALYNGDVRLPAYKVRNYIIICATLVLLPFIFQALRMLDITNVVILTIIIPFAAFVNTAVWVGFTELIAQYKRRRIITFARQKLTERDAQVIAISGTYGKTTIKEFLFQILSHSYTVAKTDENRNTDVGVALSVIQNLTKDTQYFIAEMGAYRIGEVARICQFTRPTYAILTSAGNQHVDLFGSQQNLIKAESEHLTYVPEQGSVYINMDIPGIAQITRILDTRTVVTFSWNKPQKGDAQIQSIQHEKGSTKAEITYNGNTYRIKTDLLGDHVINNLLPCIALASDLGMSVQDIEKAVQLLKPIPHKLSLHKGANGSTVLSDSSNSNVEGFIQAVRVADRLDHDKKMIMTKGIIELGKEKKKSYKRIMQEFQKTDVLMYTTDKDFLAFDTSNKVTLYESEEEMMKDIQNLLEDKTLLVIEGRFKKGIVNTFIPTIEVPSAS